MKKTLCSLALVAGLSLLGLPTYAQKHLTIVHFNDTHSHVEPERGGPDAGRGGVIERAAFVDSVRTSVGKKKMLLLHAGDFSQGTSYFTELHGDIEVELVNALGYDVLSLGNHEFDNGLDELARRLKGINGQVVCANYDFSAFEAGKYIKPYTVIKRAGYRIGIIGVLTDVGTVVAYDVAKNLKYLDPAETVNKYAKILKEDLKCDMVIVLSHIGYEEDRDLAAATRNVDLIVGGHSHTVLTEAKYVKNLDGVTTAIVQNGCWGLTSPVLDVYPKKKR